MSFLDNWGYLSNFPVLVHIPVSRDMRNSGCASCASSSFRICGCSPSGPAYLAMLSFERSHSISSSVKVTSCEGYNTRLCSTLGSSQWSPSVYTFLKKESWTSPLSKYVSVNVPSSRSRLATPCRTFSFDFKYLQKCLAFCLIWLAIPYSYNRTALRQALFAGFLAFA